jgi:hypothetical protein
MLNNVLLGADPEVFFEKDGEIISAEGMVGGTKHAPKEISEEGHSIQEDNVMAEFNIPPSKDEQEFVYNVGFVRDYLETLANVQGAKLNFSASAELNPKYLRSKQAKTFGCMPDYNYYLKDLNPAPKGTGKLRSCGGHIHIGYDNPNLTDSENIVFAMDAILGLKSLFIDGDTRRRSLYGKAGSFRFKPFGVEYRTLSNFWIQTDELISWAYKETMNAIELINSGDIEKVKEFSTEIEQAINTNNKELATTLLNKISKINNNIKIAA